MQSGLERQIQNFDGVAVSILSEARVACRSASSYFDDLVSLCFDPRPLVSNGATWILKAEIEEGARLAPGLVERVVDSLERLQSWQAKLHICQSVEGFQFTAAQADQVMLWAKSLSDHSRPFLRAWSLNARVILGIRYAKLRPALMLDLEAADADGAASVRARARKLRKLLSQQA